MLSYVHLTMKYYHSMNRFTVHINKYSLNACWYWALQGPCCILHKSSHGPMLLSYYFPEGGHTIPQIKQKVIIQVQKDAPNRE